MVPDPAPPFELGMSQSLLERIERLSDRASGRGIGKEFDRSVDRIMTMLRMSPRESGDPIRQLRGFSATEYRIVRDQLIVYYSVHNRIPMVTVWRFEPSPGHPLAPPSGNGK